jgi:xylan 1,4-beta-xylosidase
MSRAVVAAIAAILFTSQVPSRQTARVAIRVDASARHGPMKPVWAFFGYDEPNYTYMKDGSFFPS